MRLSPFLSIIIPTCNRIAALRKCLDCLRPGAQSLDISCYEVIVTDDSKGEETKILLDHHYPWVIYNRGSLNGPAANRNSGARLATGNWLVFTDDDCLPDKGWLKAYAESIDVYPDCKAFEGPILPDDWELLKKDLAACPVNTTGGCFWSANIMVDHSLFNKLNGFDEQFKIAAQEDQDFYLRLKPVTKTAFIPLAKVIHPVRVNSMWKLMRNAGARAENYILYAAKNATILGFKNKKQIYWKGGVVAQCYAVAGGLKQLKIRQTSVALYTLIFIYIPKFFFGKT